MLKRRTSATILALGITGIVACSSEGADTRVNRGEPPAGTGADAGEQLGGVPFEPVGPAVYVPKIKNLLTGLAPTDEEVQAVIKDPEALRGLIDKWMTLPSFKVRMTDFFRNAFQQNQVRLSDLMIATNVNFNSNDNVATPNLQRNLMDSFPLTVWKLIEEGRPFTETVTTRRYMMTTAMMSALSYIDDQSYNDRRQLTNRLANQALVPSYSISSTTANTVDQASDPTNAAAFMKFPLAGTQPAGCATTTQTFNFQDASMPPKTDGNFYRRLFETFLGRATFNPCAAMDAPNVNSLPLYAETDWNDWHMVTLRNDPAAPAASPAFYDLRKLRRASEMVVHTDRLGFWGTLAFQTNWATNNTNDERVTANQAAIVALGYSIAGENAIANFPVNATDADHAANPACKGCHDQLDPFKTFFRQSYSLYYGQQTDPKVIAQPAGFGMLGSTGAGTGVGDLANIMVANKQFPIAWVGKLHFWANSTAALETDPEVLRIAQAFAGSSFDFKTLVRELFSSPLLTWARPTLTTTTDGVVVSISRRDQFCAALSYRLQLDDVCGMLSIQRTAQQNTIAQRAILMPVDTYYRSFALPSLPTASDLFYRQSTESICQLVSDQIIDVKTPGAVSKYVSSDPTAAMTDFVSNVMAVVPSDPKYVPALTVLNENYAQSVAGGATPTQALKATFTLACLAPSSVIVGL